jgi:predicted MFS family arabinose efflux permease
LQEEPTRGLSAVVVLVGGVLVTETAFFSTLAPLLPYYQQALHISTGTAGVLTGSYALGHIVGSLPASWLTTRIGDRATIIVGMLALAAASLVFGFGHQIAVLDVSRLAQGIGGASVWTGAWAWLIRVAPPERRGELVGATLAGAILGVLLGPIIGTAAASVGTGAVFSGLAGLTVLLALGTMLASREHEPRGVRTPLVRPLLGGLRRSQVRTGMWLVILPGLGTGALSVLVPLRLHRMGAGSAVVGATFLGAAVLQGIVTHLSGRIADRRGRLAPLRAGLGATACTMPLFALTNSSLSVALLTAIVIGISGTLWGPANLVITEAMESAGLAHGVTFSLNNVAWAAGQGLGPVAGASVAQATSDSLVFVALGAIAAVTLAWTVASFPGDGSLGRRVAGG